MAMVLITHDLGLVAQNSRDVAVMYAGQVVETSTVPEIFQHPAHPYTEALLQAIPELAIGQDRLTAYQGWYQANMIAQRVVYCLRAARTKSLRVMCHHQF